MGDYLNSTTNYGGKIRYYVSLNMDDFNDERILSRCHQLCGMLWQYTRHQLGISKCQQLWVSGLLRQYTCQQVWESTQRVDGSSSWPHSGTSLNFSFIIEYGFSLKYIHVYIMLSLVTSFFTLNENVWR
jgi:hypothetical protein